jgi:hypothetical protein
MYFSLQNIVDINNFQSSSYLIRSLNHSITTAISTMDLLDACEDLANNISSFDPFGISDIHVSDGDSSRWQKLFNLTNAEAVKEIQDFRSDYTRSSISCAVWKDIRDSKTAEGFDKESYEYSLSPRWIARAGKSKQAVSAESSNSTYLLKLDGLLDNVTVVQKLAELPDVPVVRNGQGDDGEASFIVIDGMAKSRLLANIQRQGIKAYPTLVSISQARKELCPHSPYPTLGLDSTLPQHRPNSSHQTFLPTNGQFPVWYFVYGTLGDASVLGRLFGTSRQVQYVKACVYGARLGTWAGKYKALMDTNASTDSVVQGWAFQVLSEEEEQALRHYETNKYEVVRCQIHWLEENKKGHRMAGLTFRFIG